MIMIILSVLQMYFFFFFFLCLFKDAVIVCYSFWYKQNEHCPVSGPIVNSHGLKATLVPGSR